ncbi:MAG: O-antigen ligase family protein [Candidatus Acidiferrales bacterium]
MRSQAAQWLAYVLMSISLAAAVLLRGGVYPEQWVWSALGVSVAGILISIPASLPDHCRHRSFALWLMVALLLWMGFQLVPLPLDLVAWLSPERSNAIALARSATGQTLTSWTALSVAPGATMERLLFVVPAMVAFFVARDLCCVWRHRTWIVVIPVIAVAWLESVLGLVQFYLLRMAGSEVSSVTGTYVNRNHFAGLLEMALPLSVLAAIAIWRKGNTRHTRPAGTALATVALVGVAACLLFGVVISLSRMGFVSIVSAGLLTGVILLGSESRQSDSGRRWRWAIPVALILLLLLFLPTKELLNRFAETAATEQLTKETRVDIWNDTLHLIAAYKWTGSGLGAYERGLYRFKTAAPLNMVDFAHNDYLQIIAELGFVGAGLAAALALVILYRLLSVVLWFRRGDNWELAVGLLGALLTMGLHSLADFNLYIPANALVLAWLSGAADSPGLRQG